ncbi:MAG: tyrosine-type recombinase/integrase [Sulfuricaulis sp.]
MKPDEDTKRDSAHEKDGNGDTAPRSLIALPASAPVPGKRLWPPVLYDVPATFDDAWRLPALPEALSGRVGVNRGQGGKQCNADEDVAAIQAWLDTTRSPRTREAYRREAERLLLWCWAVHGKPVSSLLLEDLQAYFKFCADPQPADRWCGPRKPRFDPAWRPFHDQTVQEAKKRKKKSIAWGQAVAILSALFTFLVEVGYLEKNPMAIIRRSARGSRQRGKRVTRLLSHAEWEYVQQFIDALPETPARARARKERIRFMFNFLYLLVPRLGDLATHTMGSFERTARGKWRWKVTGKGDKEEALPVNQAMLRALERYRVSLGLPALPLPEETIPLVPDLKHPDRGLSANRIYRIVKWVFEKTAVRVAKENPTSAANLRRASTHWLRHTGASHALDAGVDLRNVSKMLRHADLQTTSIYAHTEDQRWEDDMERHGKA